MDEKYKLEETGQQGVIASIFSRSTFLSYLGCERKHPVPKRNGKLRGDLTGRGDSDFVENSRNSGAFQGVRRDAKKGPFEGREAAKMRGGFRDEKESMNMDSLLKKM